MTDLKRDIEEDIPEDTEEDIPEDTIDETEAPTEETPDTEADTPEDTTGDTLTEIVRSYADGKTTMDEALNSIRQIERAQYEASDPHTNEWQAHEGGYVELFSACVAFDCTIDELQLFKKALKGRPIGDRALGKTPKPVEAEPEAPPAEEGGSSLVDMLEEPDDDDDEPGRPQVLGSRNDEEKPEPEAEAEAAPEPEEPVEEVPEDDDTKRNRGSVL